MIMRLLSRVGQVETQAARAEHRRDADAPDADLHVGAIVLEELTGAVDGVNRLFFSTYTPAPSATFARVCWTRGLARVAGRGFDQYGRAWLMDEAPLATGGYVDPAPVVLYIRDPRAPENAHEPATMGAPRRVVSWPASAWHVERRRRIA